MNNRLLKALTALGFFALFILLFGLGSFLHYQNYHPFAFVAAYLVLFGLPFIWMLIHSNYSQFSIEYGLLIGLATVFLVGIYHVIHFFSDGDQEAFLLIFPLAGYGETIFVSLKFVKKCSSEKTISKTDIQKLVAELETLIDQQVQDARSQASDPKAPSEIRIGEKAYAKGLRQMGTEIIEKLKKLT